MFNDQKNLVTVDMLFVRDQHQLLVHHLLT